MSKGNLFQGQGRGKVGDVVFTVRNGEQIARVRNRHPYNPRSPRQLMQRAIMTTISMAYSAGKNIFDHSFQGKSVGDACNNYFMKRNAVLLRSQIASQLSLDPRVATACCVNYNPICPVPNAYFVSEGSLENNMRVDFGRHGNDYDDFVASYVGNDPLTGSLGDFVTRNFTPDDIFTMVAFVITSQQPSDAVFYCGQNNPSPMQGYELQYCVMPCRFGFIRFAVKESAFSSTKVINTTGENQATWGDIFEITDSEGDVLKLDDDTINTIMGGALIDGFAIGDFIPARPMFHTQDFHGLGSVALIRSRRNQDLRSTEYMVNANNYGREAGATYTVNGSWGMTAPLVLTGWQKAVASIADSDLILEGGDGE